MRIEPLSLKDAYVLNLEPIADDRGFFARSFHLPEILKLAPEFKDIQQNISFNKTKGIFRGLHFHMEPFAEIKLVRCTRGSLLDILVDIRHQSPTFKKWESITLSAENHRTVLIPKGFAHGYLTLEDQTEIFYQVSEEYHPTHYRGIRWDSPEIGIQLPFPPTLISDKDLNLPSLNQFLESTAL